ncbi:hypothetical protein EYD45_12130 [Hyunsoonleella flava]|uniref:Uncharacterized protein n=1 Tax=Hyunsoonleella flava TaxID=2527939 RepID=A0A4Q9FEJ6_9FLAO|nr:hypothetical protein [Hyunsoonleella flava]TBN02449.1 hypothetical protein EYD45_12130 [Hyunsoonleella flava]
MQQNFLMLLTLFFMVSCGPPEFEKNTRILVKGNIVDENDVPVSNIKINIYTERARGAFVLGNGSTNEDGSFSIISLFDRDEEFQIEIYGEQLFSNYFYLRDTKDHPIRNLIYDLGIVKLNRLAQLNYNITRTSPPNTQLKYAFQYLNTECFQVFDNRGLNLVESRCLEEVNLNRTLSENQPEISRGFTTLLGSVVSFTYSIDNKPEITETFTIDTEDYEFNFSY